MCGGTKTILLFLSFRSRSSALADRAENAIVTGAWEGGRGKGCKAEGASQDFYPLEMFAVVLRLKALSGLCTTRGDDLRHNRDDVGQPERSETDIKRLRSC